MSSTTPTELSKAADISLSHASMILSGSRSPSLGKALQIYDRTGLRFGILEGLTPEEIEPLRRKVA